MNLPLSGESEMWRKCEGFGSEEGTGEVHLGSSDSIPDLRAWRCDISKDCESNRDTTYARNRTRIVCETLHVSIYLQAEKH